MKSVEAGKKVEGRVLKRSKRQKRMLKGTKVRKEEGEEKMFW